MRWHYNVAGDLWVVIINFVLNARANPRIMDSNAIAEPATVKSTSRIFHITRCDVWLITFCFTIQNLWHSVYYHKARTEIIKLLSARTLCADNHKTWFAVYWKQFSHPIENNNKKLLSNNGARHHLHYAPSRAAKTKFFRDYICEIWMFAHIAKTKQPSIGSCDMVNCKNKLIVFVDIYWRLG